MTRNVPSTRKPSVIESSGNVFADLGLPEPEITLAKARLAIAIAKAIESQRLTQQDAVRIAGLDQAQLSDIQRGRLRGVSIDRLFRTLNALGQDVDVFVHGTDAGRAAHLNVTVDSISE